MPIKIMETNNYAKFELLLFNRDVGKTKALEASMRKYGFIPAHAIHVVRQSNGKFYIKEGHHRFHVARSLGINIFYVERHDQMSIFEAETAKTNWTLQDYLDAYTRMGKEAYLAVKEYRERTGIGLSDAISMLAGDSAGSGNWNPRFKQGTFRLGDPSNSAVVADIVLHCAKLGIAWARHPLFVQAISKVAWVKDFDPATMKNKISVHLHHMRKQPTKQDYINMLEEIYNRQSRVKKPLAFLAEEA
jgi:hypothetical protein